MDCALFTFWLEKNHQHIVNHAINILNKQIYFFKDTYVHCLDSRDDWLVYCYFHSFSKYLLSSYYMSGTCADMEKSRTRQTKTPCSCRLLPSDFTIRIYWVLLKNEWNTIVTQQLLGKLWGPKMKNLMQVQVFLKSYSRGNYSSGTPCPAKMRRCLFYFPSTPLFSKIQSSA